MNDAARPVWITEQEAEITAWLYRRWEAAPANATEAAREAGRNAANAERIPEAVLRALGMPDA